MQDSYHNYTLNSRIVIFLSLVNLYTLCWQVPEYSTGDKKSEITCIWLYTGTI